MKTKDYRGITLIALIITIIVLLILAGVSISMVVGDNGILSQAVNATTATDIADTKEQIEVALVGYLDSNGDYTEDDVLSAVQSVLGSDASIDEETEGVYTVTTAKGNTVDITDLMNGATIELISTDKSYTKYYADIDGNGSVDGVIYADLLIGGNGTWGSTSYSYNAIESSKNYYIIKTDYLGDFGTADVIAPIKGSTGEDRFYVMALEDISSNSYCWYYNAYYYESGMDIITSSNFGTGKSNTTAVMNEWKAGTYGEKNGSSSYNDIWGAIEEKVDEGWFVPSNLEWAAFGNEFEVDRKNYSSFGLSQSYWSSSQYSSTGAWYWWYYGYYQDLTYFFCGNYASFDTVRLSITF